MIHLKMTKQQRVKWIKDFLDQAKTPLAKAYWMGLLDALRRSCGGLPATGHQAGDREAAAGS